MKRIFILISVLFSFLLLWGQNADHSNEEEDLASLISDTCVITREQVGNLSCLCELIAPFYKTDSLNKVAISWSSPLNIAIEKNFWDEFFKYFFPFLTFAVGVAIPLLTNWISDRKEIDKGKGQWINGLTDLRAQIEILEKEFDIFFNEYKYSNSFDIPDLIISPNAKGDILKILDKQILIKYINRTDKNQSNNELILKISELSSGLENAYNIKDKIKVSSLTNFNDIDLLRKNIQLYLNQIEGLIKDQNSGVIIISKDTDLDDLKELSLRYFDVIDLLIIEEYLNKSKDILIKYKSQTNIEYIIMILNNCMECINKMKQNKTRIIELIEHYKVKYIDLKAVINEVLSIIN